MRTEIAPALIEYAPAGSDIYYVLRQVPIEEREAYLAVHALVAELYKIAELYRELNIAQQKLAWWQEEIKRLYQQQASHPLTKILQNYVARYDIKEIELLAILESAFLSTRTQIFATTSELRQHYQHTGGIPAQLKAKVLLTAKMTLTPELTENVHQLGIAQEILRHLLDFPKFLSRQHLYLPLDLFQVQGIDPQPILQNKDLEKLALLFDRELNTAETIINAVKGILPQALRPLLLEAGLKLKQAEKTQKKAWQIFNYRLELSPLVKFLYTEFF
jgi:15-cis-phytoene synthase